METMYIKKKGVIIIGDTLTGNENTGERFFLYTLRDAIKEYRQMHNLVGKHFRKVYCDKYQFGYSF